MLPEDKIMQILLGRYFKDKQNNISGRIKAINFSFGDVVVEVMILRRGKKYRKRYYYLYSMLVDLARFGNFSIEGRRKPMKVLTVNNFRKNWSDKKYLI